MKKKIVAVVVTFNRKALLMKCLESICRQSHRPDRVLIIDNASTDGTKEELLASGWLAKSEVSWVQLSENTGGAGGFASGLRHAINEGADWIWCMDDDCIPEQDALEKLMRAESLLVQNGCDHIGFLASRVLWTDKTPCLMNKPTLHPTWMESQDIGLALLRVSSASFVSVLISRGAIDSVGYPIKEFFIWFDDVEFTSRISKEMPAYYVGDSVVHHLTGENLVPLKFQNLTDNAVWKYRYGVRNQLSYILGSYGWLEALLFIMKISLRMSREKVPYRLRVQIYGAFWDGIFFRYKQYIMKDNKRKFSES